MRACSGLEKGRGCAWGSAVRGPSRVLCPVTVTPAHSMSWAGCLGDTEIEIFALAPRSWFSESLRAGSAHFQRGVLILSAARTLTYPSSRLSGSPVLCPSRMLVCPRHFICPLLRLTSPVPCVLGLRHGHQDANCSCSWTGCSDRRLGAPLWPVPLDFFPTAPHFPCLGLSSTYTHTGPVHEFSVSVLVAHPFRLLLRPLTLNHLEL